MDELAQHFKNLENDETLKKIDDAYNRGWNDAMNNPEVKKALERMKPKKVIFGTHKISQTMGFFCPSCNLKINKSEHLYFCKCGQLLDWS